LALGEAPCERRLEPLRGQRRAAQAHARGVEDGTGEGRDERSDLRDSNWVREPFVHDQWLWEGATTDASPVQNRVRKHLEVVEVPKRVAPVVEDNR
jgi:hypothetical protein